MARRRHRYVRLATILVVAQAGVALLTGLPFAGRDRGSGLPAESGLPAVSGVVALALGLLVLAAILRTGTPAARTTVLLVEIVAFLAGAGIFLTGGRWLGGTIFAGAVTGVLLHPAVASAFGVVRPVSAGRRTSRRGFGDRRATAPRAGRYDRDDGRHEPPRD